MTARIARGAPSRARQKPRASGRSVNTRKTKSSGLGASLGLPPGAARRLGGWTFTVIVGTLVVIAAVAFRVPQLAGTALAEGIGRAGFTMKRVEIKGAQRVSRLAIYNVAFDQPSMAMPLVDLDATRARLLEFGWIKEARVSRRLPDTLVVDVVERRPAAIWQNNRRLSLIDAEGVVLEPVRIDAMPDLPLVIGPAANRHLGTLNGLIESAPRLRPQLAGATWVGDRRWDLRFQSGELLSLPEGEEPARRAIQRFQMMDQQSPLLGQGYARIDMRIPGRMIVRLTREPGRTVPELAPPPPTAAPGEDLSRTI
jgi:cell division protein FtsQ